MHNFFWPTARNPESSAVTRFGRVLHWLTTALAIAVLGGAAVMAAAEMSRRTAIMQALADPKSSQQFIAKLRDGTTMRGIPHGTSEADIVAKLKRNGFEVGGLQISKEFVFQGQTYAYPAEATQKQIGDDLNLQGESTLFLSALFAVVAFGVFLGGRSLRYVLSAE